MGEKFAEPSPLLKDALARARRLADDVARDAAQLQEHAQARPSSQRSGLAVEVLLSGSKHFDRAAEAVREVIENLTRAIDQPRSGLSISVESVDEDGGQAAEEG